MLLAACGNGEIQPAAVNEATDKCETCNMAAVDDHNATQIVLENGKSLLFDDIGCMFEWLTFNNDQKIAAKYVRDFNDKEWVALDKASYVYNSTIKTPMAYNVISFKDQASAEQYATEHDGSTLLTALELEKHEWVQNKEMLGAHGAENAEENHDNDVNSKDNGESHDHSAH